MGNLYTNRETYFPIGLHLDSSKYIYNLSVKKSTPYQKLQRLIKFRQQLLGLVQGTELRSFMALGTLYLEDCLSSYNALWPLIWAGHFADATLQTNKINNCLFMNVLCCGTHLLEWPTWGNQEGFWVSVILQTV